MKYGHLYGKKLFICADIEMREVLQTILVGGKKDARLHCQANNIKAWNF